MSTFEERLRERINNLISETMDDAAAEVRKAVTPPAKAPLAFCAMMSLDGTICTLNPHDDDLHYNSRVGRTWRQKSSEPLRIPGEIRDGQVYINFDSKAFGDWFARQIRIHGGIGRWLPR